MLTPAYARTRTGGPDGLPSTRRAAPWARIAAVPAGRPLQRGDHRLPTDEPPPAHGTIVPQAATRPAPAELPGDQGRFVPARPVPSYAVLPCTSGGHTKEGRACARDPRRWPCRLRH